MDDGLSFEQEFRSESSVDADDHRSDQYTGAFFPGAQNLVVAGGKFKSITNITHAGPMVPSDFRMIPMGDLDLREEIRPRHRSGVAYHGEGRVSVRRVYSARIHGSKSKVTVAVYQRENAEEEWREDISRYSWLRHPNLVQLFATATSTGIHAAIFHDDLVPAQNMLDKYHGSHLSTVYLYHYLTTEFDDVAQYMVAIFERSPHSLDCMMWIRCSTGRLCIDLTKPESDPLFLYTVGVSFPCSVASLTSEPPDEWQIIQSTPLDVYHKICAVHLRHFRNLPISPAASVHLGAIISYTVGTGIGDSTTIAGIPDNIPFQDFGWWLRDDREPLVMENGWTRVNSSNLGGKHIHRTITPVSHSSLPTRGWLAQAFYIFNRLGITSNYGDYVLVHDIIYQVTLSDTGSIPPGYLLLCPLRDLESEIPSHFRLPECPAYWSLDLSGAERLSTEEADELGFPRLELRMEVYGDSWDKSVYTGIHQFHEGKDYDPYSQDVARELGYPLYEVVSELESFQEAESCSGDEDSEQNYGLRSNNVDGDSGEDSSPVAGICSCGDDAEPLEPSRTCKIVMVDTTP